MSRTLEPTHLQTLDILSADIENLSETEQLALIRKKWKRLCVKHHPDKPSGNREEYDRITTAYTELTKNSVVEDVSEMYQYVTATTVTIPETAFDIIIQEGIEHALAGLRQKFLTLRNAEEKQRFATYYSDFLNVARQLELQIPELNYARADYLHEQDIESLGAHLTREWRMLIIRLFGEEYLDDFKYRHALATGELGSILALRKLLSPVKLAVAIINSLTLLICSSAEYYFAREMIWAGSLFAVLAFIVAPVGYVLDLLARPINGFIRPLAESTGIPSLVIGGLSLAAGAAIGYAFMSGAITLATIPLLLPYITVAINLYSLYLTFQSFYNMQEAGIDEDAIIGYIVTFTINTLLMFIMIEPISDVICATANSLFLTYINQQLKDRPIEHLPLPKEQVSEEMQQAVSLGYKKAHQSNRFFSTPADAEFQNQRSAWQKTCSFFGLDLASPSDEPDFTAQPLAVTAS